MTEHNARQAKLVISHCRELLKAYPKALENLDIAAMAIAQRQFSEGIALLNQCLIVASLEEGADDRILGILEDRIETAKDYCQLALDLGNLPTQ